MARPIPLALAAALLAASVAPPASAQEGNPLFEEGAQLLFRGLIEEVAPPLQELAGIGREVLPVLEAIGKEMGPAFADVFGRIDSITYYEPPVIEPNGDIVLRRRADAPAWTPPAPEEAAEEPAPRLEPRLEPRIAPRVPPRPVPEEDRPLFDLTPPPEGEPLPDLQLDQDGAFEL